MFIILSLTTQEQIKIQFISALTSLANKNNGLKMKAMVINVFSSIGNPNLSGEFSQNVSSNHFTMAGI